jgi:L-cysteine:1D-myo-inositol 2-amino-2-deoxy-alpha-D-glucopyranoside ligase
MLQLFAERGGDPDTPGKRDQLDPVLWRSAREGEPSWDGGDLGPGRPGWHIECTAIALNHLETPFDVQGGGSDLAFPHHEMGASHAHVLTGSWPYARTYAHAGMVGLHGTKMSKSKGNLVLVSQLRADGVDPMAIRLALLSHHYREDWNWVDADLANGLHRLDHWRSAMSCDGGPDAESAVAELRAHLAGDLDAPSALAVVDRWADEALARGGSSPSGPGILARAVDALLGVRL